MKIKSENSALKRIEILVAEDSPTQATQIKHLLESHHYKVIVAHDGEEAISKLSKHTPALVISDIVMPEMNGYELCRKIKSNKNTQNIPVILLTRLSDPEEIIEGLSCGADSFITKPYNEKYLLSHVERILSEENGAEDKKLFFDTQILFKGKKRFIQAEQQKVIQLMLNIYEGAIYQNERLVQTQEELRLLNERLESIVEERTSDLSEEIKLSNKIAERLKENEEIFSQFMQNCPIYVFFKDANIRSLRLSRNYEQMLDKPLEELLGKTMYELFPSNIARKMIEDDIRILKEGKQVTIDEELDGKYYTTVKFPIYHNGKPKYLASYTIDITERKQSERILLKLNMAVNNTGEVIFMTDKEGTITYINMGFTKMYGYTTEDVIGKATPRILNSGLYPKDYYEQFWNALLTKKRLPASQYINKCKNGKLIDVEGSVDSIIDDKGEIIGFLGIQRDITERKQIELELINAKEKAEESNRLKSAFLTNMSHEIRTPMNGILGFTELLKEPNLSGDDQQDFIQTIQISGARMLNTINNIVDVSKIESGLTKVDIKETNINEKMEFIYKFFKPETEKKGLQFIFKNGLPSKEAIIKTDNEKMYGVLTNLIKNAIKFTYDGLIEFGYVLKSDSVPAELEFYVKDTGVGIPKNQQQIVFERFRQGSYDLSRLYEGSGLGLSISKSYVEMLGGRIWVESVEGSGSTFYFTIPYNPVEVEKAEINGVDSTEIKEVQIKKLKILIVEDDEVSYSLLKRNIQKIGKDVLHAITGVQAIEACRSNPDFDLVLMDIRMPQMNGLEATKQIREFNKDVIIIAQTAYGFSSDREKALEAGCNDYISKPIKKTLLLELIEKHVNKL